MTIAVMLDFSGESLSNRDGIFVHTYHLVEAWLKYDLEIHIEVWVYSHAERSARDFFDELMKNYGRRIIVLSDSACHRRAGWREKVYEVLCKVLKICEKILNEISLVGMGKAVAHKADVYEKKKSEALHNFVRCFQNESKADICYVPFVTLEMALRCKKIAVIQIHDLFTFQFYRLFVRQSNPPALYFWYNWKVKKLLTAYAKAGAVFVSSSDYTVKNQIQRYIKAIDTEKCEVILFPPLLSEFDEKDLPSKQEFKEKIGVIGRYIAFPSQNRPNKNLILLLKALKEVREKGHFVKLVTTGCMKDVRMTNDFCKKNKGLVIEVGNLRPKELFFFFLYSDLVVCPNLIEGIGISGQALEALKIGGIPVIHARTIGIEEVLKKVGLTIDTADLNWVDPFDSHGLAEKITEVLEDSERCIEKQKMVVKAFEKIKWSDVSARYLDIFRKRIDSEGELRNK